MRSMRKTRWPVPGVYNTADDRVYVRPSGQFKDVEALRDTLIRVNGRMFRLGDIADITSRLYRSADRVHALRAARTCSASA